MSSNTIIRAARNSENPYAQIARSLFEDERISWRAKGLMGYLLSRKDGWKVFVADLQKRSTDGRDACYKALDELGRFGYLERLEVREKGRIKGYEYVIHEVSCDERAASWKTVSGKAVSGKAVSGNTVSGKTDTSNNLLKAITEEAIPEEEEEGQPDAPPTPATAAAPDPGRTEDGKGSGADRAEPPRPPITHQDQPSGSQTAGAETATHTENVPGAAGEEWRPQGRPLTTTGARAALGAGFKREGFLDELLGEYEDRAGWLDLAPERIRELVALSRNAHGRKFTTPLIAALDEEARRRRQAQAPPGDPARPTVSPDVLAILRGEAV